MTTITEAIARLKAFNQWRRGDDGVKEPDATRLGKDIDLIVEYFDKTALTQVNALQEKKLK